jgi:hypothetical protein
MDMLERRQARIDRERGKRLRRVKALLQKGIDLLSESEDYFSDTFDGEQFLDFDLSNSLECAMEDVDHAIDGEYNN